MLGGAKFVIFLSIVMIIWTACTVGADIFLGMWAKRSSDDQYGFSYLLINTGLALTAVVCIIFRVFIIFYFSINGCKRMHEEMLSRIMKAPINTFFDKTPVGRIINRFSNDLHCLDLEMPFMIGNALMAFWRLMGIFALTISLIYWSAFPIPFVLASSLIYLHFYLQLQRQLKRIEKISRSPILQYTAETYTGATTVRAYGAQTQFLDKCYSLLNNLLKCNIHVTALECWVTLRIQFVSTLMNILTVLFVVFLRIQ